MTGERIERTMNPEDITNFIQDTVGRARDYRYGHEGSLEDVLHAALEVDQLSLYIKALNLEGDPTTAQVKDAIVEYCKENGISLEGIVDLNKI
jgi:hypothetical protein